MVSLEGDNFNNESTNALKEIQITNNEIRIVSLHREYVLDVSGIDDKEIKEMVTLLGRQNYDNRFTVKIA